MLIKEALEVIKEEEETKDQYDLAVTIGVSQGTISNYLKGKSYPTLPVAASIYNKYGIQCEPYTELALVEYNKKYGTD